MLKDVVHIITKIFVPLKKAIIDNPDHGAYYFLYDAGVIGGFDDLSENVASLAAKLKELTETVNELTQRIESENIISPETIKLLISLSDFIFNNDLQALKIKSGESEIKEAGNRIWDYLIVEYLKYQNTDLYALADFIGAIELNDQTDIPYIYFHYNKFVNFFLKPNEWLQSEFGWNTADFDAEKLLYKAKNAVSRLYSFAYFLNKKIAPDQYEIELAIPLLYQEVNNQRIESGIKLGPAFLPSTDKPSGIKLSLYGFPQSAGAKRTGNFEFTYQVKGSAEGAYLYIFPDGMEFDQSLDLEVQGELYAGTHSSDGPVILLGSKGKTRVEVDSFGIRLSANQNHNKELTFELLSENGKLHLEPSEGDGFIQGILSSKLSLAFSPSISWSRSKGISFNVGLGLERIFPIHKKLGPLYIQDLLLGLTIDPLDITSLDFKVATALSVNLGPVNLLVSRVGIETAMRFKRGGNLGFLDFSDPKLSPPDSIAITLQSKMITGDGFLEVDKANHQYTGLVALNLQSLDLTGIAIIQTRLPNGQPGFSMLVTINVIFQPAVQLAFGFTLNGVGGLIGINRTFKVEALKERMLQGAVESIMFPEDPVKNADRIISDLQSLFPAKKKHYVVAPFLKIAYGTPPIIEIDLGLLFEIPFKEQIILLGTMAVRLPSEKSPMVKINVDVYGDLNFGAKYIQMEGRLRQSSIMGVALTGGFAFLLDWGDKPAFLYSIGGYHPRYKKPARFPDIPRLTALIKKGSNVSIFCEYYQAITSNSFQIGFAAHLLVKFGKFRIEGHFGFNALLQFDPFRFDVDISLGVNIKYKKYKLAGISLYFNLLGPSPWIVSGSGKFKVAFIKVKFDFRFEWGRKAVDQPLVKPVQDVLDKLVAAVKNEGNWNARLPANFETAEMLKPAEEISREGLVMHPSGYLEFRQTVVPLNRVISKFGNARLERITRFEVGDGSEESSSYRPIKEFFARSQFSYMSDADKLSSPDFEQFNAGFSFGENQSSGFDLGTDDTFEFDDSQDEFENIVVKADRTKLPKEEANALLTIEREALSEKSILHKSVRGARHLQAPSNKHQLFDLSPEFEEDPYYAIVDSETFDLLADNVINRVNRFDTYTAALEHIQYELGQPSNAYRIVEKEAVVA
jgi:hypothetical protein